MLDFYDHLYDAEGRQRVSIAEASQTAMIAGYEKWQFTYYWAPFILFGNWQ
jgi:CHAT domain-containing protein